MIRQCVAACELPQRESAKERSPPRPASSPGCGGSPDCSERINGQTTRCRSTRATKPKNRRLARKHTRAAAVERRATCFLRPLRTPTGRAGPRRARRCARACHGPLLPRRMDLLQSSAVAAAARMRPVLSAPSLTESAPTTVLWRRTVLAVTDNEGGRLARMTFGLLLAKRLVRRAKVSRRSRRGPEREPGCRDNDAAAAVGSGCCAEESCNQAGGLPSGGVEPQGTRKDTTGRSTASYHRNHNILLF